MIPIENRTPFEAELLAVLDNTGREVRVLVIVATFESVESPQLAVASRQEAICFADEYHGEPGASSVLREADVCPPKPLVDVIINGFAHAPGGKRAASVIVGLKIGDIQKELRVVGDRLRSGGTVGRPVPFQRLPIVYERSLGGPANGGQTRSEVNRLNPVGVGFQGAAPTGQGIQTDYPNVEHMPSTPQAARTLPAGFGIVGRGWTPRLQLAGTYDEAWLSRQWPLPPRDFDNRHFQCAPQDQQSATIQGGEMVRLVNLTSDGMWEFRLPRLSVPVFLIRDRGPALLHTRLDTVYICPELRRVVLCHRVALQDAEGEQDPREIVLGHMTGGWLNARCTKRHYLDPRNARGEIPDAAYFS